jgi:hypothetical protein
LQNAALFASPDGQRPHSPSFELRPAPNAGQLTPEQWNESYNTMMQFLQSMNGQSTKGDSAEVAMFPSSVAVANNPLATSSSLSSTDSSQQLPAPLSTQQFLGLVDWDASMQCFQDTFDLFPSNASFTVAEPGEDVLGQI